MASELSFREPSSMIISVSSYCYETLSDYRDGTEFTDAGTPTRKHDYKLSTERMILVEIAFIPLIVLSGIETVVRGALYLVATPFLIGICICSRKENESVRECMVQGAESAFAFECIPLATLTASVKGLYRNIFSDELPGIGMGKDADRFISEELSCGFSPDWLGNL